MKAREVFERIRGSNKGAEVRQRGSHIVIRCECHKAVATTVVPVHGAKDLGKGLLRSIERDLEPRLGKRWLTS